MKTKYMANGLCASHLQAMSVLCAKGILLTSNSYVAKLGNNGNLEVYSLAVVDMTDRLFQLGVQVEVELKLKDLNDSYVLKAYETE